MSTDKIYNDLGGLLKAHWDTVDNVKNTKENISQYFKVFSDMRYFANRTNGEFLYQRNEKGEYAGLNYEAIYAQSPELTKLKKDGTIDEEASKKYVDEVFKKTNEAFQKLKIISDFSNYSRFHEKFGKGKATSYLPIVSTDLRAMKNLAVIYETLPQYINNALSLVKKVAENDYDAIIEDKDNNNAMNSFLTICNIKYKALGDEKFSMNKYVDEKLMNIISALDSIDKDECSQPLMNKRMTPSLARDAVELGISPETFKKSSALTKGLVEAYITVNADLIKKDPSLSQYFTKEMYESLDDAKKKANKSALAQRNGAAVSA
ncbi:MAG: hypothetical protein WC376_03230 [Candidatus Nanoarchaeia archaeon]|jgi:hypothetical protein